MNSELKKRIFNILGPVNFPENVLAEYCQNQRKAHEPFEVFSKKINRKDFQEVLLFGNKKQNWKTSYGYFEKLKFLLVRNYLRTCKEPAFCEYLKILSGSEIVCTDAVRKIIHQKEKKVFDYLFEVNIPKLEQNIKQQEEIRKMMNILLLFSECRPNPHQGEEFEFFLDMVEFDLMPIKN